MNEFFKTLLMLNVQGSVLVILLLLLKGIIRKSFSGKWQRNIWIFVAVIFLLPVWKFVPEDTAPPIILPYYTDEIFTYETEDFATDTDEYIDGKFVPAVESVIEKHDLKPWIWGVGAAIFLILNIGSYTVFLIKKRKDSKCITDDDFLSILQSMDIKRKIRLRQCDDVDSPMLTGVLFPVVYLPKTELTADEMRYIYRHELTHYKHKDLPVKWFVCIINAINWFNPFMYFVMKNLNEACEIYCDEDVTYNMDDECKRQYMNTILNLVAKK